MPMCYMEIPRNSSTAEPTTLPILWKTMSKDFSFCTKNKLAFDFFSFPMTFLKCAMLAQTLCNGAVLPRDLKLTSQGTLKQSLLVLGKESIVTTCPSICLSHDQLLFWLHFRYWGKILLIFYLPSKNSISNVERQEDFLCFFLMGNDF